MFFFEIYFAMEGSWGWGCKQGHPKPGGNHGKIRAEKDPTDGRGKEDDFNSVSGKTLLRAVHHYCLSRLTGNSAAKVSR